MFSLTVKTASKMTFIKYNLMLERANLFKPAKEIKRNEAISEVTTDYEEDFFDEYE